MAVYTLTFGQITTEPGAPELTPQMLKWIEEQANIRIPVTIRNIINEAMIDASMDGVPPNPIVPTDAERAALEALRQPINVPPIYVAPEVGT